MDSTKEINNNTKEFDDCLISTQDDCIIIPNNDKPDEQDEPFNEIKKNENENDNENELKEEYLETRKFYSKLRGFNRFDLTEDNFKYWKGEPYVGRGYRDFINTSSKIMVCTSLINERIQINIFDKLVKQKKNNKNEIPMEKGLLKYLHTQDRNFVLKSEQVYYSKKSIEYLQWRFKSHLYRFGFIKSVLNDKYDLNYNDFKTYKDIESYFNLNLKD